MSVQRYRSVADMPPPERPTEDSLALRIRTLWNRAFLLSPPDFARGVTRFRTIEAANAARNDATIRRMRARSRTTGG